MEWTLLASLQEVFHVPCNRLKPWELKVRAENADNAKKSYCQVFPKTRAHEQRRQVWWNWLDVFIVLVNGQQISTRVQVMAVSSHVPACLRLEFMINGS